MKNKEKSLMEEILNREKSNGKNGLLDNDDTLLNSTVKNLPEAKKTEQLQIYILFPYLCTTSQ